MTDQDKPLRIAVIAGEESGDLLASDLVQALRAKVERPVELVGVGGSHLEMQGLKSWFDPAEIALMGFSAVIAKLPKLLKLLRNTSRQVIESKPDCLIIVDSPDFSQRVAARVRKALPDLPIVNYVCPSVWAWRPGRAKAMSAYIDHVLCLLPFEPAELSRLNGPTGTYVGHRLRNSVEINEVRAFRDRNKGTDAKPTLLVLPGSRRGEVSRHAIPMVETVQVLRRLRIPARVLVPTLPRLEQEVRSAFAALGKDVEISSALSAKWRFFAEADAALAASGTVTLELALCNIPHCSVYRLDPIARLLMPHVIKTWSGCLPNLIADRPIIPEAYDTFFAPELHGRMLAGLMEPGSLARAAQIEGFKTVWDRLSTDRPAGDIAALVVVDLLKEKGRL